MQAVADVYIFCLDRMEKMKMHLRLIALLGMYYSKRRSACYIVREVRERERVSERERETKVTSPLSR